MGTLRFGNDHFAAITGYGDYVQGNLTICHVYYVEGLVHNLFSVGQFCDGDLEVAFRSNTCYVRNLEGDDLLTASREPITQESSTPVLESHSDAQTQEDVAELDGNTIMHSFENPEFEEAELRTDAELCMYAFTVSLTEPKNNKETMLDHSLMESMQDKLNKFERLDVWELVPLPEGGHAIKVKWLWKNKTDAKNTVIWNKSCLVAKGYSQQEGIDFEDSFAPAHD
ncbi:retrovirus-related pol polyprotein from transposon TNT 1-94 [Tanacetum coccineum]